MIGSVPIPDWPIEIEISTEWRKWPKDVFENCENVISDILVYLVPDFFKHFVGRVEYVQFTCAFIFTSIGI